MEFSVMADQDEVARLRAIAEDLANRHFDLGEPHSDMGALHCLCDLAAQYRVARAAWVAAERSEPLLSRYEEGYKAGEAAGLERAAQSLDEIADEYTDMGDADDEFADENDNLACHFRARAAAIRALSSQPAKEKVNNGNS
jgi:hypothetical protein